jgi:hypothetical protein
MAAAALIFGLRRWPRVPASMIVIVLAICVAWLVDLGSYAIAAVGAAPPLALHLGLPDLPYQEWLRMAELSAVVPTSHGALQSTDWTTIDKAFFSAFKPTIKKAIDPAFDATDVNSNTRTNDKSHFAAICPTNKSTKSATL